MIKYINLIKRKNLKSNPVWIVLFLNFLLAITAFGKDVLLAQYLGTSEVADAFSLAYFIPDTIGNNMIATTLGVVCIPIFTRLIVNEKTDIFRIVTIKLISITCLLTSLLMIILFLIGKPLIQYFGHGLSVHAINLAYDYFILMLPIVVLHSTILIGAAYHQSNQHFLVPAMGPVLFNLLIFLSLLFCILVGINVEKGGFLVSVSMTLATIVYLIFTWVPIRLKKQQNILKKERINVYLNAIAQYFLSYFLILLFSQSVLFFERSLASQLEEGTIAGLSYAYRLSQFPVWVFVAAITTVILPSLSRSMSNKQLGLVTKQMYRSIGAILVVSILSSLLLFFLREPIITLLFKRGAFTNESVEITSNILAGYSLSIVGQSISLVCIRYYVAKRVMKVPVFILFISTMSNVLFDVFYVPVRGASALGYGALIGSIIGCCLFLLAISKEWNLVRGSRMRHEHH